MKARQCNRKNEWLFKGERIKIVAEEMGKLSHYFTALSMEEGMREKMTFKNVAYSFMLLFSYKWIWQCLTEVETLQ